MVLESFTKYDCILYRYIPENINLDLDNITLKIYFFFVNLLLKSILIPFRLVKNVNAVS